MKLYPFQERILKSISENKKCLFILSRGGGKSFLFNIISEIYKGSDKWMFDEWNPHANNVEDCVVLCTFYGDQESEVDFYHFDVVCKISTLDIIKETPEFFDIDVLRLFIDSELSDAQLKQEFLISREEIQEYLK